MFSKKALYQYGSNPNNTIKLSVKAADIMNKTQILEVIEKDDQTFVKLNLTPSEARLYNVTAGILNKFIESKGGSIDCEEDYLDHNDILTRIK